MSAVYCTIVFILPCFLDDGIAFNTFSLFFCFQYLMSGWAGQYSFRCQPVDYSNDPMALRVSFINYFQFVLETKMFATFFLCLASLVVGLFMITILLQMANTCWWYYFSKFTEFFDTVSLLLISLWLEQSLNADYLHKMFCFAAILCPEEKEPACVNSACYPSWCYAFLSLDGSQVCSR